MRVSRPVRVSCPVFLIVIALVAAGPVAAAAQTLGAAPAITTSGPVVGDSLTLVWGAVPGASHYHVQLQDAAGRRVDEYYRPDQTGCAAGTVCELRLSTASLTPGVGQWQVQAWSPTAEGPWSEPKTFTYAAVGPDGVLDFGTAAGATATARTPSTGERDAPEETLDGAAEPVWRTHGGPSNTHLGTAALANVTAGLFNTGLGHYAMTLMTMGSSNTAVGRHALYSNMTGSFNTALGELALFRNTDGNNTAVGAQALFNSTTGRGNTGVGLQALYNASTSSWNTALGFKSLYSTTTGTFNTGLGTQSLYSNTIGTGNVGVGVNALMNATTGSNNTAVGYRAGLDHVTGSNNIYIGHPGFANESNIIRIGDTQTFTRIAGKIAGDGSLLTNVAHDRRVVDDNGVTVGTYVLPTHVVRTVGNIEYYLLVAADKLSTAFNVDLTFTMDGCAGTASRRTRRESPSTT